MNADDISMTPLARRMETTEQGAVFRALCELDASPAGLALNQHAQSSDLLETIQQNLREQLGNIPQILWPTVLGQCGLGLDSDMGAMIRAIVTLQTTPRPLNRVEAIAVRPGLGEMRRWEQAVEALRPDQFLIAMGAYDGEKTWRPTPEILAELGIDASDERVVYQATARNTKDQSRWFVETLRDLDVSTAATSVAGYHQVRSFATDVATLRDTGLDGHIMMYPFPTDNHPEDIIPETSLTMGASYEGELRRIKEYSAPERRHVATWDELYSYLSCVALQRPLG
jgi:hypothetical protein